MASLPETITMPAEAAMSNYDLALSLAREGFHVFPCLPEGETAKRPYPGVMWAAQSTTDEGRISSWWRRWPDAVPGLDLKKSSLVVIDLDGAFGLEDWPAVASGREPDESPIVSTPSGGQHWYFRQPEGDPLGNGRGDLPAKRVNPMTRKAEGIDVRGAGGYTIAPGSMMKDGRYYAPLRGDFSSAPRLPAWLASILRGESRPRLASSPPLAPSRPASDDRRSSYGHAALDDEVQAVATAPQGMRNETVNTASFRVGQLVGGGCLSEAEAYDALASAVLVWGKPNDKALGPRGTVARALRAGMANPRTVPDAPADTRTLVDMSGLLVDKDTGEIVSEAPIPIKLTDPFEPFTTPPGLLGDIVRWITETSQQPQPGLALGAALTIIGTAAGRHIAGPTRSGTQMFVTALAPSGAGKDRPAEAIAQILSASDMRHHVGPSQFMSMPAVINLMRRSPLTCCAIDEFGSFLKRINNRRASGFEGAISGELRKLWGGSFKVHMTPEWAGRAAEAIHAPCLSIYGTSTAEEFYGALEGADTTNGVLNRFLIVAARTRPPKREPLHDPFVVPERISRPLAMIYGRPGELATAQRNQADIAPGVFMVPWGQGAQAAYEAFAAAVQQESDDDIEARPFLARTVEMAVRLATIRAIGEDLIEPKVTVECMEWACGLSRLASDTMRAGALDYISDTDVQAEAQRIIRLVKDNGGRLRHRDLLRLMAHRLRSRDLKDILNGLLESETLVKVEERSEHNNRPIISYSIAR